MTTYPITPQVNTKQLNRELRTEKLEFFSEVLGREERFEAFDQATIKHDEATISHFDRDFRKQSMTEDL